MNRNRVEITVPDLGLSDTPITISVWLSRTGSEVYEGDRVLELFAGAATVDVGAPASGRLVQQLVLEDETVVVGQIVGVIEVDALDDRWAEQDQ